MSLLSRTWLLFLGLLLVSTFTVNGPRGFAFADEDADSDNTETTDDATVTEELTQNDEDADEEKIGASPDAETTILFIKPAASSNLELPAGQITEFLVGFTNKGNQDMIIETVEAAFHYPMDHTFVIQNFSAIPYYKTVRPSQQATVGYSFIAGEPFAGRPFGLAVNIAYRNMEGAIFREAVFNETVNIVEVEEGLDGETFFLYVFLAAGVILLLVLGQQTLVSIGRKRGGPRIETGTKGSSAASADGIDYEWLPRGTLNELNKSPKRSPRRSPRLRKNNKGGSGDEE
nr:EOG090X0ETF [Eulimnadia texana]